MQAKRQSLRTQAGALFRKNAVFQRRNMGTNVCLLASPIVFCVMLLVVQVALNRLLTGENFEVGGLVAFGAVVQVPESVCLLAAAALHLYLLFQQRLKLRSLRVCMQLPHIKNHCLPAVWMSVYHVLLQR